MKIKKKKVVLHEKLQNSSTIMIFIWNIFKCDDYLIKYSTEDFYQK